MTPAMIRALKSQNVPPLRQYDGRTPREWTTEEGSYALAKKIEHVWHAQGHRQVRAWTVKEMQRTPQGTTLQVNAIKSNLVGGLPPVAA